jgi:hypothetical protein
MKDFELIEWKGYNKPPYLQQWLTGGDPKKLVSFGDKNLEDVNQQVLGLKDSWDLDNVRAWFLDRIGKLMNEKRSGNTDEYYRTILKLRTILNTNDGTVNSIIKAIKFLYQSEVIHIVPDYPAGLIIEHDGEGTPGLNFNKLLNEIIAAGVSFSTKEIFPFTEVMPFHYLEEFVIDITYDSVDIFSDTVHRNGRVLRDGHTVKGIQLGPLFRNGSVYYDGQITGRTGGYWGPAIGRITSPIYRNSGIMDFLEVWQVYEDVDEWESYSFRNNAVQRNGMVYRCGKNRGFNDLLDFSDVKAVHHDNMPFVENLDIVVGPDYMDDIGRHYRRDGSLYRQGYAYRSSDSIIDSLGMESSGPDFEEAWKARLVRNGMAYRNGVDFHNGHSWQHSSVDVFEGGQRKHHFHDGTYLRDGEALHDGMVLLPL